MTNADDTKLDVKYRGGGGGGVFLLYNYDVRSVSIRMHYLGGVSKLILSLRPHSAAYKYAK